jgi:hypothetical protein
MTEYVVICESKINGKGYVPEETYKQLMNTYLNFKSRTDEEKRRLREKIAKLEKCNKDVKDENDCLRCEIGERMKNNEEMERKSDFYQIDNEKLREEIEVGLRSEYETGVSFAGRLKELKLEIDRITGKKNQEETPLSQLAYEEISESYTFEELVKKCVQQEDEIERVKQINNEQRCALQKYYQKMDAIKELTEG